MTYQMPTACYGGALIATWSEEGEKMERDDDDMDLQEFINNNWQILLILVGLITAVFIPILGAIIAAVGGYATGIKAEKQTQKEREKNKYKEQHIYRQKNNRR